MKKLLIGLLVLGSFSSYARDCNISIANHSVGDDKSNHVTWMTSQILGHLVNNNMTYDKDSNNNVDLIYTFENNHVDIQVTATIPLESGTFIMDKEYLNKTVKNTNKTFLNEVIEEVALKLGCI